MDFAALVAQADRTVQGHLGAVAITYQPASGPAVEVQGMFDRTYELADGGGHSTVETIGPSVFLRLEDLPVDPDDDEPLITVAGVSYRVHERQRDPLGESVRLLLHKVA